MKIKKNIKLILQEIKKVLDTIKEAEVDSFSKEIINANKIVVIGAGRMGLASKAFAMRLAHMGFSAYFLGDSNIPSIGKGDLLIVASGSGETSTIYEISKIARKNKSKICLITANPKSRIGKISNIIVVIQAPTKHDRKIKTIQPMTTLNEQSLGIFYDALVLDLMNQKKENHDSMWKRHSNLE